MKKIAILLVILMLLLPLVNALDDEEEEPECKLSEIATCIINKISLFIRDLINSTLQPFLSLINKLLTANVNIDPLIKFWKIIVYVISSLFALLLLYSGFNFMISGYDIVKRENAKTWIRNSVIMIILINVSYYVYSWSLELSSSLTSGILNLIPNSFFTLSLDSFSNLGIELSLTFVYLIVLLIMIVNLSFRYLFVMFGLILFPLGLFLYFFEPLKSYGKLIINAIGIILFIPFIDSLILLMGSQLLNIELFTNYKILVMITSFVLIILLNTILILFIISKSTNLAMNNNIVSFLRKITLSMDVMKNLINIDKINEIAILKLNPINFSIMNDQEKEVTIKTFQKFLNSLEFGIQILVSTNDLELNEYYKRVNDKHIAHLNSIIKENKAMNRDFYLIIPKSNNHDLDIQVRICQERLTELNLISSRLNNKEIEQLLINFFSKDVVDKLEEDKSIDKKDYFYYKIAPKIIENYPDYLKINDKFNRIITANGYPRD